MKPDWRVMVTGYKGATGRWAAFYVTMNRKGEIVLSGPTWQKMGEPKAVHLLFDTVNNRIGLKPTVPALANAVRVGIRGKCGGRVVRAYPLMQEFRIHIPETLRFYDADIGDDGVLILDLRTARVPPGVRRRNDRLKNERLNRSADDSQKESARSA